jgi:hypothetical protein
LGQGASHLYAQRDLAGICYPAALVLDIDLHPIEFRPFHQVGHIFKETAVGRHPDRDMDTLDLWGRCGVQQDLAAVSSRINRRDGHRRALVAIHLHPERTVLIR